MQWLDMRCGIFWYCYANVREVFEGAAVKTTQAYCLGTVLVGIIYSLQKILGPSACFVFSGAAVNTYGYYNISIVHVIHELLHVNIFPSIVIYMGCEKGAVFIQRYYFES